MKRTTLPLLGSLLLLGACMDRELPTALAPEGAAFSTYEVGCDVTALIAALNDANATAGPQVIDLFPGCTYTLTSVNNTTAFGPNGLPVLRGTLTINGNGARVQRSPAEGTPALRIFHIGEGATVSIADLTLSGGIATQSGTGADDIPAGAGAGVLSHLGTLTLTNVTVSGNHARSGGGIYSTGTLMLVNSTVSGNRANSGGGGIQSYGSGGFEDFVPGTVTLTHSTVSGNRATYGGGISNAGTLTLTQSTVSGNTAHDYGGGISNVGTLSVTLSTISGNRAEREFDFDLASGGGLFNYNNGTVTLTRSTVSNNRAVLDGGGIYNGGEATRNGTVTLTHSTVANNEAGRYGGGLYANTSMSVSTTVQNSTLSGNRAGDGGGVFNHEGPTRIVLSTLTGNHAVSNGGGVWSSNNTLTRTEVKGSLIWGNTRQDGATATPDDVAAAQSVNRYRSLGYNLIGAAGVGVDLTQEFDQPGDQTGVPPTANVLHPVLGDNGGPTRTHALLPGSPALDSGTCTDLDNATVATDQRGIRRPQGSACDIGAYELSLPGSPPPTWSFRGFFLPVKNPPAWNRRWAGGPEVLRWSLGGDHGLDILAPGSPASRPVDCRTGAVLGAEEPAQPVAKQQLHYVRRLEQYVFGWQTEKRWRGSCREFVLRLSDGSEHTARFRFN